jgi:hypothetical protein
VRILPDKTDVNQAIAAVVAFQDRYDLSVRLEWDQNIQRYKIMANTLADLTKRENRFGHFFYRPVKSGAKPVAREYPFALISVGSSYSGITSNVLFVPDPEIGTSAKAKAAANHPGGSVVSYTVSNTGKYFARPFAFVDADSTAVATAQAILNDDGEVVRIIHGPVPLRGTRRGEDVMLTNALAFDLRVYDPGAPVFASVKTPATNTVPAVLDVVLTPSDPGWRGSPTDGAGGAYFDPDNMKTNGSGAIGSNAFTKTFLYVGQGAYVDLGYGYDARFKVGNPAGPVFPFPKYAPSFSTSADPWFFTPRALSDVYGTQLAPGYAVYDTWSFHYENNGVNEDGSWLESQTTWHVFDPSTGKWQTKPPAESWRQTVDQGTDGLDNDGQLGVDDIHERETAPPYDKPLRGMQALIRVYERDSRSMRQVRVNQHFMPE